MNRKNVFFITATGTGIGKTFITSLLIRQLRRDGKNVQAYKPIISGYSFASREESDTGQLLKALGQPVEEPHITHVSPWRFEHPLSPDMAACRVNQEITTTALYEWSDNTLSRDSESWMLMEGVGGVMVPINAEITVLDWMKYLGIPVVLVTGTYLGTLSHTLTAYNVLRQAGLTVQAMIVNESEEAPVTPEETIASLSRFLNPIPRIVVVPRIKPVDAKRLILPDIASLLEP